MIFRGFAYQLSPTPGQHATMRRWVGVCRLVYNLALEQRQTFWRQYLRHTGGRLNYISQGREVTALRSEFDWIAGVPCNALHKTLRDLDQAFSSFFAGNAKHPRFRRKGESDNFRLKASDVSVKIINGKWGAVKLPKIGWVKFRATRPMIGELKSVTVSFVSDRWHISFHREIDHEASAPLPSGVGIDRGVLTTLALSTGEMLRLPESLELIERRKRKAQRVVARRKRGSNRRRRAQRRVARFQARQARIRRDFHHRAALAIARRFGVAVVERLTTRRMTASAKGTPVEPGRNVRQKAGLNRAILNAGWYQFQTILTYKMEERGGQVIVVPAHHTSQTCSACGVVDAQSRKSQAVFECVSCGHADHADTNAALEILRRGSTSSLRVEGSGCGPVEARTKTVRKHRLNLALVG